jgi:hypothetical protein
MALLGRPPGLDFTVTDLKTIHVIEVRRPVRRVVEKNLVHEHVLREQGERRGEERRGEARGGK